MLAYLIEGLVKGLTGGFTSAGLSLITMIQQSILNWFYDIIFGAVADFFTHMGNMGAELFDLTWVQATIKIFTLFGWGLFVAGVVVAVFDLAIEFQNGRASVKTTVLNILKGFFACSLIGIVPVELYKFTISLQNTFAHDLTKVFTDTQYSFSGLGTYILNTYFRGPSFMESALARILILIAFGYCVVKIFFQNIKRGGILLVQMSVGSLYMFSVPRGYTDGFVQWMKQVVAICLTAFMQTTLLFLGLLTFKQSMLLGLGVMLAAGEVPRIAQQFGLDSSTHFNMQGAMQSAYSAVNMTRMMQTIKKP